MWGEDLTLTPRNHAAQTYGKGKDDMYHQEKVDQASSGDILSSTALSGMTRSRALPRSTPERSSSADDRMTRILALEIMEGRYDVTGFPSEGALQRRFQVSRRRAREVMRDLAAKGIWRAGTRTDAGSVRENPVFGEDLRSMCLGLECEAARRAARRRSWEDLEVLQQCLADLAARPSAMAARTIQRVFRLTICAALGRSVARSLSGLIEAQLLVDARWEQASMTARSQAMRRVFLAIQDGDETGAAAAMRGVIA